MNTPIVTIIGAGWLGAPLAQYLSDHHYRVYASRTTAQGASELNRQGIQGFCFTFDPISTPLAAQLKQQQTHTVIGCFPPGFRKNKSDEYAREWEYLVQECQSANVKKLIMISSTGVYPNRPGEMSEPDASLDQALQSADFSASARILLTAEQYVATSDLNYVILRCSGLFGPQRHPSRFVGRLSQVSRLAPANMLHLDDAIGAVTFAIENLSCGIFNVTTPTTVSKAEFYQAALDATDIEALLPPIVALEDKRILGNKLCDHGYRFRYQSTLEALREMN
jgi:nucleoside-diphosphate-sugar epimerase